MQLPEQRLYCCLVDCKDKRVKLCDYLQGCMLRNKKPWRPLGLMRDLSVRVVDVLCKALDAAKTL
ncbi:hypothetical protein [Mumia zhuanghuii]|uniref:Uncharacterized protein n=1 Tax=Mumia zhuanghuii TaxID=2585211 RepID=A0A5C4MCJ4_9ACTN|nr:hypothetical protein [Mumia zhuanghuii]TNC36449.1 hypothetical protein FHE65_26220 [Mumia zhuanghuii]